MLINSLDCKQSSRLVPLGNFRENLSALQRADLVVFTKNNLMDKQSISNEYRNGDIRHCYADITKAKKLLDFDPQVKLEKGLSELDSWVEDNKSTARDLFENSLQELKSRNLT